MINKNVLKVILNKGEAGEVDYTNKAFKFENDNIDLSLTDQDYLYLGYYKKVNYFYFDIQTPSSSPIELTIEKYNGSTWEEIANFDETENFKKKGFIYLNIADEISKFDGDVYIRVKFSGSTTVKFRGINVLFCSEEDLKFDEPNIERFYPRGFESHVLSIEASTRYIMRKINNSGKYKYDGKNVSILTRFDMFNIEELREACTYYALYKIMFNRADSDESDNYRIKGNDYLAKFNNSFNSFKSLLTIDLNDDGKENKEETSESIQEIKFVR